MTTWPNNAIGMNLFRPYRLGPTISQLLSKPSGNVPVSVTGWIRSIRRQKRVTFAVITDGSNANGLQAVFADSDMTKNLANGVSVSLTGKLAESPGRGQETELQVQDIHILGECDPKKYPIQKQALSVEYLRDYVHLRPRTNTIAAMLRLRSALSRNISSYFEDQAFFNVHSPILTGNDAEGSGETFRIAPVSSSSSEYNEEFFGLPAHLTVSSQLHLEALATSLSRVYTLSPCFRAERSQTSRHLSEFWMLEAEWVDTEASSPSGVHNICSFVEDNLRNVVSPLLRSPNLDELWSEDTLQKRPTLEDAITSKTPWTRMTYTDAIKELSSRHSTLQFEFTPKWGSSLQSEHERWLAESFIKGPVFITDYPKSLKPFYMRANPTAGDNDQNTVACFDLIVPYVGELVGGSVREERAEVLEANLRESKMSVEDYEWYLDLRRYGGFPHLGFGMGFERLVAWVGGIDSVRECIAIPRWAGRMQL